MPGSDHRQLERVCRRRIAELDLPSPLQMAELKTRLETRRGRELWVLPDQGKLPPEVTGVWIGTATRDYVYYQHGLDGCLLETTRAARVLPHALQPPFGERPRPSLAATKGSGVDQPRRHRAHVYAHGLRIERRA